jgi:hypothetical protein
MEIKDLWRLVLRFVFAEGTCGMSTQSQIEQNLLNWKEFVDRAKAAKIDKFGTTETDSEPVGKKGTYIDEVETQIQAMAYLLVCNEKGELESKKDTYKRHQIDFRDTAEWGWAYPERWKHKNYKGAQRALEQNMKDNPELYR